MEATIKYLIESSIILGILTIFYRLVLHNEPMFRFNRLYLLFSLLLAAIVPALSLSFIFFGEKTTEGMTIVLDAVDVYSGQVQQTIVPAIAKHVFFNWLYILGALILFARLIYGFIRLGGLSREAEWLKINGYKVANLPGRFNPFSFFHIIFVNRSLYSNDDLDKIMKHEIAHVRFKHSLDVVITEVLLIVQWFNPFAWIIRTLLKELHEFQADKEVIKKGTSIGQYKMLLLFQASGARLLPVNNFNQSITKKRFKMMTNNSLKNSGFVKAIFAAIMLSSVTFFFSCDNVINEVSEESQETSLKGSDSDLKEEPTFFIVEQMPKFTGGEKELRKFIAKNIKYPVKAVEKEIQGRVYVSFIVSKEGKVKGVKIKRGIHETLNNEAIRVVSSMPDWKPGFHKGKAVNVSFTVPINFALQSDDGLIEPETPTDNKISKAEETIAEKNAVYVIGYQQK